MISPESILSPHTLLYKKFCTQRESVINTSRDLGLLSLELGFCTEESFIAYLSNKMVLDVGSGLNGLAIGTYLKELPCKVFSVNPDYGSLHYVENRQKNWGNLPKQFSATIPEIIKAEKESLQKTCVAYAHVLPFRDQSFDVLIDCFAVSYYCLPSEEDLYFACLQEMVRVTKLGGHIRIGCADWFGDDYFKGNALRRLNQTYTLYDGGVEITRVA